MRISFDLDDTLICYDPAVPREHDGVPWLLRPWFTEPLRQGTRSLLKQLVDDGWEITVYTTSHRSPSYLRWWFWWMGVKVRLVVNQTIHENEVLRAMGGRGPSKNPRHFGISLHVDDLEGVAMEGREYGFEVVVVRPENTDWANKVLEAARRYLRS